MPTYASRCNRVGCWARKSAVNLIIIHPVGRDPEAIRGVGVSVVDVKEVGSDVIVML